MRVTLQCNDYTLHEGSIPSDKILRFVVKNTSYLKEEGGLEKRKILKEKYIVLLGETNNKVAKNILFWRKRWRKK